MPTRLIGLSAEVNEEFRLARRARGNTRTSVKIGQYVDVRVLPNKLTASEYDETTWSARTWMAFTTQRLSSRWRCSTRPPAQEVAEALGLSVAADPRAASGRRLGHGAGLMHRPSLCSTTPTFDYTERREG